MAAIAIHPLVYVQCDVWMAEENRERRCVPLGERPRKPGHNYIVIGSHKLSYKEESCFSMLQTAVNIILLQETFSSDI